MSNRFFITVLFLFIKSQLRSHSETYSVILLSIGAEGLKADVSGVKRAEGNAAFQKKKVQRFDFSFILKIMIVN